MIKLQDDKFAIDSIAKICHEANKAFCESIEDYTQHEWEHAPDWQRESARQGVISHLTEVISPEESHEKWMEHKLRAGWRHGEEKDAGLKTHPALVAYDELPSDWQVKDKLFSAIVEVFREHYTDFEF